MVAQGLLGGLTVKLNLPLIVSATHATLAQLFFLITVSLAVFTSKRWIESEPLDQIVEGPPVRALCVFSLAMIRRIRRVVIMRPPRPTRVAYGRAGAPAA